MIPIESPALPSLLVTHQKAWKINAVRKGSPRASVRLHVLRRSRQDKSGLDGSRCTHFREWRDR